MLNAPNWVRSALRQMDMRFRAVTAVAALAALVLTVAVVLLVLNNMLPQIAHSTARDSSQQSPGTVSDPPVKRDALTTLKQKPVSLPAMEPGGACLVTTAPGKRVNPAYGIAVGDGPVYAVGITTIDGMLGAMEFFKQPDEPDSEWGGAKVLWVVDTRYAGPVLVRGQQIDGPNELRFGADGERLEPGPMELTIETVTPEEATANNPSGWRHKPSNIYVTTPGCYGFQIDGQGFSYNIVFKAVAVRTP